MGTTLDDFRSIVRWETSTWNDLDALARRVHGIPLGRYEALYVISGEDLVSLQKIALALRITDVAAGTLVGRLEAAGMCTNDAPTDSPSSASVRITEAGSRLVGEVEQTLEEYLDAVLRGPAATAARRFAHLVSRDQLPAKGETG
jgi:DNA-binding MarR family transcriptional regulator